MGASTIATRARPSHSKFIFRAVVGVLVLLLIVFLAVDLWFYREVRSSIFDRGQPPGCREANFATGIAATLSQDG